MVIVSNGDVMTDIKTNDAETAFVYIRRTPRALNFHPTTGRPVYVRKAGTQMRRIRSTQLDRGHSLSPVAQGLIKAIKQRTDMRTLEVDLAEVALHVTFDGYTLTHMPESPAFRECIKIERSEQTNAT
jgi:hypothetical protein